MRRAILLISAVLATGVGAWWPSDRVDLRPVRAAFRGVAGPALLRVVDAETTLLTARSELAPDARFSTGSGRKWVVAAVVLAVADEGQLRLDDPVARWLPAWRGRHRGEITVRQLLAHTSGMETRPPAGLCADAGTLAGCVDRLALRPLLAAPGTRFRYSTGGFVAAARVAEAASGRPWAELCLQERLLDPVRMTSTGFVAAGEGLSEMDGELWTTLPDWANFLQMLLGDGVWEGRRVLSEAAVEEMFRGQTGGVPTRAAVPTRRWWPGRHDPYGLGVWRSIVDERGEVVLATTKGRRGFAAWIDRRAGVAGALWTERKEETERALVALADATRAASRDRAE